MEALIPNLYNETGKLEAVVLGLPESIGREPLASETYDAKSYDSVVRAVYPKQEDINDEMQALLDTLLRYRVKVLRPDPIENCNQVFARDVAFVVDDTLFVSNLISDRDPETAAYGRIFDRIPGRLRERMDKRIHVEGGDVLLYDDILFIGTYLGRDYNSFKTARTNSYAVDFFRERFPSKTILPLELRKHDTDPFRSSLHLDCVFQPVGRGKAVYYPGGFLHESAEGVLSEIFGRSNLFSVTDEEAYHMNTNIFSISPDVVISEERFTRLNRHLADVWGITVETVPYREVSKMGGLLRCSTLPLRRS